ncbi:MAG: sigma-70 family RNA polymerase sigma factor, partial [Clostridia bacterium]|nr:sigma-70 family RNA polymerase sigma factor [Clostridia bacterium]
MFRAIFSFLSSFAMVFVLHVANSNAFPEPLSKKKEEQQIALMRAGDKNARNTLIEHNLRLVAHIVKKYAKSPYDQDDLVSIGTLGLIKAVDSFDPDKSIKLSSYAARCIENEILMHFRSQKKSAFDVSLDEAIETDKDGNPLTLMDILSANDNVEDAIDLKV